MIACLEFILWVFRFFMGACVFSFINVVICRLPRGESVVKAVSYTHLTVRTMRMYVMWILQKKQPMAREFCTSIGYMKLCRGMEARW